jgi:hypothetical protein
MKFSLKLAALTVFMSVSGIAIAEITAPSLWQNGNSPDSLEISTNQFLTGSNSAPIISAERPAASQALKPGVYQTYPYICVIKVPAPEHDDCMVHELAGTNSTMPISKPDLRFVPIPQKEK